MKYLILLSLLIAGCDWDHRSKSFDCSANVFQDRNIGFMVHGEFFSGKRAKVYIVHVVNPQDWDYNMYFTGKGFSSQKEDAMDLPEADTCTLKEAYLKFITK